jgi:hypothetical protein
MDWKNARSVETKIRGLTREIERNDAVFYESEKARDRDLYAGMLERKREALKRLKQCRPGLPLLAGRVLINR